MQNRRMNAFNFLFVLCLSCLLFPRSVCDVGTVPHVRIYTGVRRPQDIDIGAATAHDDEADLLRDLAKSLAAEPAAAEEGKDEQVDKAASSNDNEQARMPARRGLTALHLQP